MQQADYDKWALDELTPERLSELGRLPPNKATGLLWYARSQC
jgi:hypothetical protein